MNIQDYGLVPNTESLPGIPARVTAIHKERYTTAHSSVGLPAPECLMARELVPGGLQNIRGQVSYADYRCLT